MPAPDLGAFIRPVGDYGYCLEVVKVLVGDAEGEQWHCRRWGMNDHRQPVADGHGHGISFLSGLIQVAPGVWRDEWEFDTPRWTCCPLYYRRIDIGGQMSLFE
jgi:hypothetical protein